MVQLYREEKELNWGRGGIIILGNVNSYRKEKEKGKKFYKTVKNENKFEFNNLFFFNYNYNLLF